MIDQASVLRQSMWRERRSVSPQAAAPRRSVAVVAGKGGVGTTTVAMQLATAWAHREQQVCILDTDTDRNDVAHLFHIPENELALRQRTPLECWYQNTLVAAAGPHVASVSSWSRDAAKTAQLADQLLDSPHPFDALVIDVGYQSFERQLAWCRSATQVVLVSTPDTIAILDSYGFLKRLSRADARPALGVVCNQVVDEASGHQALQRLCESSRRFLGWTPRILGQLPMDPMFRDAGGNGSLWFRASPTSTSARAVDQIAGRLDVATATTGTCGGNSRNDGDPNFRSSGTPCRADESLPTLPLGAE